jgi:D-alanine-D-alanine ligase
VFNLAEGVGGRAVEEPRVAALLELMGVPFTGSSSETLALCRRKDRSNAVLRSEGLPVPAWRVAEAGTDLHWSVFPAIVKPVGEDGSVGIHESSVAEDGMELEVAIARAGGRALVQRFVGGRELNVGVVGDRLLPISEIRFSSPQRVVSYAAKWAPGSQDDRATVPVCPAHLPVTASRAVSELARAAWAAVGGQGYGRVDLRMDEQGRPWILEVNPNPDLAPDAGLARMAAAAGWTYATLVERILEAVAS